MRLRATLLATAIIAVVSTPAIAKPQHHGDSPRVQVLEKEVSDLREQIQELQQFQSEQVAARNAAQAQAATAAQAAPPSALAQTSPTPIDNGTTQLAAKQVDMQKQLDKAAHPTSFAFKGITITPGGFLETAGIYRGHNQANDISTSFNATPFPNVRTAHTGEARFSARQSRVSFLAEGDASKTVHLAYYTELDFQGAAQTANSNESNSYNPRLRNIYGTVDWKLNGGVGLHLLAGQNWSLATLNAKGITPRNEVTPQGIDAQYVPGFIWARQPQVRLAADFMDHQLWIAVSAENPQTTFYTTGAPAGATAGTAGTAAALPSTLAYNIQGGSGFNSANTLSLNHVPDLIAKVAYEGKVAGRTLHVEGFGIYRDFYDRVNGANSDVSGFSGGGSIALQLIPNAVDVQFSGITGKGVGRYGTSQLPDTTFRPDGTIAPIKEYALLAGVITHPTKMLDVFGYVGEEVSEGRSYTTTTGLAYGYGNPLYTNAGCLVEGSAACVGNTRSIRQLELGFWQRLYQGPWGRIQVGTQYSHTIRRTFEGVGGAPSAKQDSAFVAFRYYPF